MWPALLLAAAPASSQTRPLQTEPATTAAAGTLVLETGGELIAAEPSYVTGVERALWAAPLLRLVHSPADQVELDLEWVALVGAIGEEGRGDVAAADFGDVTLRAKWRLIQGRGGRPTLGARFAVTLPQTSYEDERFRPLGLGPNTLRARVEALASSAFGRLRLHLNAGLFVHDEVGRPHDQRDFLSYGLAAEWTPSRGLTALAEWAGRAGDGMPGAEARSEARFGIRLGEGRLRADIALRRGLAAADGTWGASAGLAWTVRAAANAGRGGGDPR